MPIIKKDELVNTNKCSLCRIVNLEEAQTVRNNHVQKGGNFFSAHDLAIPEVCFAKCTYSLFTNNQYYCLSYKKIQQYKGD